ncbi:xanthine dehydrogenase small subunit [Gellertiella hungarica]|uniref:Xanthine dehydrogenase small subunit n=1 Tax=Gellertiella hungarica TaxID=1572859 RepID=A0A7W6J3A1_9HYPH|nr:xanthine dehydrogenase small subunit [Gellertiella hungarica]MBB4063317.1 xanthine dehydrogenase small subunit [Gellertiella hungarica]
MASIIRFLLNGEEVALSDIAPTDTLLDYLRLRKRLTGTKEGCAEGDCGACTVLVGRLVDGALAYEGVNACIRFLGSLSGTHVVTVEHLAGSDGALHPIQQAMVDYHGSQCGFCTPGFVMSLYGLWLSHENPGRPEIERALQGNLCRCTGYEPIVKAALAVTRDRPSVLFDPLEKTRTEIMARLWTMQVNERVTISKDGLSLIVPSSAQDLAEVLADNPQATVVAGSTDVGLWVTKQMRQINPVVFINHLAELQAVDLSSDGIRIGAGVTYSQAMEVLARNIPGLQPLLWRLGGEQVRNMGTIGGNIANGSPIGDMPPPLIALGATVHLRSAAGGQRSMPLENYFIAYGKQAREPGEFVEAVTVPRPARDAHFAVYKISKRRDEDISALCGAFHVVLGEGGRVSHAVIAFGGMAATPKRARAVEKALLGKPWTVETIEAAKAAFDQDYQPLTDWRATADYRQLTARNLLTRFYLETTGEPQELKRFAAGEA